MILLLKTLLLVSLLDPQINVEKAREIILQAEIEHAFETAPLLPAFSNYERPGTKVYYILDKKAYDVFGRASNEKGPHIVATYELTPTQYEEGDAISGLTSSVEYSISIRVAAFSEGSDKLANNLSKENSEASFRLSKELLEKILSIKSKGESKEGFDALMDFLKSGLPIPGQIFFDHFLKTGSYKEAIENPAYLEALANQEKKVAEEELILRENIENTDKIVGNVFDRLKTENLISSVSSYRGKWQSEDKKYAITLQATSVFDRINPPTIRMTSRVFYFSNIGDSQKTEEFLLHGWTIVGSKEIPMLFDKTEYIPLGDETTLENRLYEKMKSSLEKLQKDLQQL